MSALQLVYSELVAVLQRIAMTDDWRPSQSRNLYCTAKIRVYAPLQHRSVHTYHSEGAVSFGAFPVVGKSHATRKKGSAVSIMSRSYNIRRPI